MFRSWQRHSCSGSCWERGEIMENKNKTKRGEKAPGRRHEGFSGSFTVEATLLMAILLPMLLGLMFAGFYLHDRVRMRGAAGESAALFVCMGTDPARGEKAAAAAKSLSGSGAMWMRNVKAGCEAGELEITVSMTGTFPFPVFTRDFLTSGTRQCREEVKRKAYEPASLIRKVRGVEAFADRITDPGEP